MRVLLVQSYLGGNEPVVFPLGLACLGPGLVEHDVRTLDLNVGPRPFDRLAAAVQEFRPELVGISIRNIDSTNKRRVIYYYPFLKQTVEVVKQACSARVVVGGSGFSMFAEAIMADEPRIDYGVYLEGEQVLPRLLSNLDTPERVPSLYYRRDGRLAFSGRGSPCELEAAELPDRGMVPSADYRAFPDAFGVETKRGCPLHCIYCVYGFLNGRQYRLRSPAHVVDDIENLAECGADRFTFVDSVFNLPRDHAEAICRELSRRRLGLRWSAWMSEKGLTGDFLDLAASAGCDRVIFSPDGFTDAVLRKLGKEMTQADILHAFDLLKEREYLEVAYNFFKNPPGQTLWGFLAMMGFCIRAKTVLGRRAHIELSSLRIEPRTRLHEIALEEGVVDPDDDLLYPRGYTQARTRALETLCDAVLRLKGK